MQKFFKRISLLLSQEVYLKVKVMSYVTNNIKRICYYNFMNREKTIMRYRGTFNICIVNQTSGLARTAETVFFFCSEIAKHAPCLAKPVAIIPFVCLEVDVVYAG